jgi:hypothetical protein
LVSNAGEPADIRARIRASAAGGRLKHVLLIGDAPVPVGSQSPVALLAAVRTKSRSAGDAEHRVPAHYAQSKVTLRWGSEPTIATDNYYADLDDDLTPDLAVGRLTADSPRELTAMIDKIIAYEHNEDFGPWRTRVNFVAGTGGFGPLADRLLELVAGSVIARNLPAAYTDSMTYACWQSPFCPQPRRFAEAVIERLNEGCAFWVYIGHGSERHLAGVSLAPEFRWDTIFSASDVRRVEPAGGPPIAILLACRTGGFDKREDCLAEELLRCEGGPVAVLAGSRVTMPYAMTVLGLGMMAEIFENRRQTVGAALLHAKRRLLPPASDGRAGLATALCLSRAFEILPADLLPLTKRAACLRALRIVATLPAALMQERAEHVALFNLFGDPLLRLPHPAPLELAVPRKAIAGAEIVIRGTVKAAHASANARGAPLQQSVLAQVEIVTPHDRHVSHLRTRHIFDASRTALAAYDVAYRQANDRVVAAALASVRKNQFAAKVRLPAGCDGRYHVRVVVKSASYFAAGSSEIVVEPTTSPPPSPGPVSRARANSPVR